MPRGVSGVAAIVGVAGNILARALLSRARGPSSPRCNLLGDGLRDLVDPHFGSRGRCQLRFPPGGEPEASPAGKGKINFTQGMK
jgi:hypothetical protein